jgi:predicted MFS family arabinose efflux permease
MKSKHLIFAVAMAEITALAPFAAFAALLPMFVVEWHLTNAQAGWIGGAYFMGYLVSAPALIGMTDRVDARRVMLVGAAVSAASGFGFAWLADGFWTAMIFRALAGVGLAGVFMPGLKAMTDRLGAATQSRAVTTYTASFSIGVALSFAETGALGEWIGWRTAFAATGVWPVIAFAIAWFTLAPMAPAAQARHRALLDFSPVLRNREAMAYILGYSAHCFELVAMRGWITAFLIYAAAHGGGDGHTGAFANAVAAGLTLLGVPASVVGNELAMRYGRRNVIVGIMAVSAVVAMALGFAVHQPYWLVLLLAIIYSVTVAADSGSLTSGTVAVAQPEYLGATMALHSTLGFGVSFLGPVAAGVALDWAGGPGVLGWGLAFTTMGLGGLLGAVALLWLAKAHTR